MALTPQDVQGKLFTTVRLREGYETSEVDEFCEEVEAELTRLLDENDDLRAQLVAAREASAGEPITAVSTVAPDGAQPPGDGAPTASRIAAPQEIVVRTSEEVSAAAARVLEMAQRTADEYLSEVRTEADQLVTNARSSAERLTADARAKADEVDRETHERTTSLERQLSEQRREALDRLQEEKRRLESELETLRSFEREYRGRLRTFLESQLDQLSEHGTGDTPLAPAGAWSESADGAKVGTDTATGVGSESADGLAAGDSESSGSSRSSGSDGEMPVSGSAGTDPADGSEVTTRSEGDLSSAAPSDDGATAGHPHSAYGRILEEEERDAQGR